jgi:hypothetical protein
MARALIARVVGARAAWPRPDFASAATSPRRGPGWLLVGGLVALTATTWQGWQVQQQRTKWETSAAAAAERIAALRGVRGETAGSLARGTPAGAAEAAQRAREAARLVVRDLDHDWPAVLGSIEQATPRGVRWLTMAHDARRGELRLEGQAGTQPEPFAVVDALARDRAWQDVALLQFAAEAPPGGASAPAAGVRFTVSARRAAALAP